MEQVAWGFVLPEGPTVDRNGALYVSDVVGGGVHRIGTILCGPLAGADKLMPFARRPQWGR